MISGLEIYHNVTGEMIAVDLPPYSIVSGLRFQMLIKNIFPNYSIPSQKYFTENIPPDIYQNSKQKDRHLSIVPTILH